MHAWALSRKFSQPPIPRRRTLPESTSYRRRRSRQVEEDRNAVIAEHNGNASATGILSKTNDGYGFLKSTNGHRSKTNDVYVSQSQIRRFGLRPGDEVSGQVRLPKEGERYLSLVRVEEINGIEPDKARERPHFENLTPIFPTQRMTLETARNQLSTRLIDLVSPIGRGQRGMIVSPPKAGKTTILKQIANGISENESDVHLLAGLIGVAISALVAAVINTFFTAYLSAGTVILAFSICVGVGIVFGLVPAWNAARANPIDALGYG